MNKVVNNRADLATWHSGTTQRGNVRAACACRVAVMDQDYSDVQFTGINRPL